MIKNLGVLVLLILLASSFTNDPVQKKRIRSKEYNLVFYVSVETKKTQKNRHYFWYKSGEIHQSFGDAGGELLHSKYTKYYHSNELAEKGNFKYGLKTGLWKSWFKDGTLKSVQKWKNGNLIGTSLLFDEQGELIQKGSYSKGRKHGLWINYVQKDTVRFKKGELFISKKKDSIKGKKIPFYKRIFSKKDKKSNSVKPSNKKKVQPKSTGKKESFFKRIFRKKNKKKNAKG